MVATGEPFCAVGGNGLDGSGAAAALVVAGVGLASVLTSVVLKSVMDRFLEAARVMVRRADTSG
jgi:hypothetical protein